MKLTTWLKFAYAMDAARVWPRTFISMYLWELTRVIEWYLISKDKSWDIAAFITAYAALCVPLLKWYMESGVQWNKLSEKWFELPASKDPDIEKMITLPLKKSKKVTQNMED